MELDCKNKTERCLNCSNHFSLLRPKIKEIVISRHFKKDFLDYEIAVKDILDCNHSNFTELHKFEEHVEGNKLFRAKNNKFHIVYAVDNKDRIIFFWTRMRKFIYKYHFWILLVLLFVVLINFSYLLETGI